MFHARGRFGLPTAYIQVIGSTYRARYFVLKDGCQDSTQRQQRAGIAQGCLLSPYLFIIVQSVLLHDVDQRLGEQLRERQRVLVEPDYVVCTDLLYADDTLLFSSNVSKLQTHMELLVDEGSRYGLELNWEKTVAMNILNDGVLTQPNGEPVKKISQTVYLGGMISSVATAAPEVSRRLGEARGSIKSLSQCLSHANITRQRNNYIMFVWFRRYCMAWSRFGYCSGISNVWTHFMPNAYDEYAIFDILICRECPMRSFYRRLARLHLQNFLKIVNVLCTTRSYVCRRAATCDV